MFPIQYKTLFVDGELLTLSHHQLTQFIDRLGGHVVFRPSKGIDYMVQGEGAAFSNEDVAWGDGVQYLTEWDVLHALGLLADPDWAMEEKRLPQMVPTMWHPENDLAQGWDNIQSSKSITPTFLDYYGYPKLADRQAHEVIAVQCHGMVDALADVVAQHHEAEFDAIPFTITHLDIVSTIDDAVAFFSYIESHMDVFGELRWLRLSYVDLASAFTLDELLVALPELQFLKVSGPVKIAQPCRHQQLRTLAVYASAMLEDQLGQCAFPKLEALDVLDLGPAFVAGVQGMNAPLRYLSVYEIGDKEVVDLDVLMTHSTIDELSFGRWSASTNVLQQVVDTTWWSRIRDLSLYRTGLSWQALRVCCAAYMPKLRYLRVPLDAALLSDWASHVCQRGVPEDQYLNQGLHLSVVNTDLDSDMAGLLRQVLVFNQCGYLSLDSEDLSSAERRLLRRLPMPIYFT